VGATLNSIGIPMPVLTQMAIAMGSGGLLGTLIANKVAVTDLPQLVALFHSFVGLAAVFSSVAAYIADFQHFQNDPQGAVHLVSIFLGTFIGAITFTGSLVAFGKLHGLLKSNALSLPGKHLINLSMFGASMASMYIYMSNPTLAVGLSCLGAATLLSGALGIN
jgi:H+-translocating NAD(P) transhydrogenase